MVGEGICAASMADPGAGAAGAQLGALPAGMELQAQAGDRNPGDRGEIMDVFSSSGGIFLM